MEVFTLILKQEIIANGKFKYHAVCKELEITHLHVVDDLLALSNGDVQIVTMIKKALEVSTQCSGLHSSMKKDTPLCYLCTCEHCGNILIDGACLKCNSGAGNSFTYDPIPKSFNKVQSISNPPLQSHFNIYLCQVKAILTMVMNVRNESRLSMSRNRATIKTLVIMLIHMTHKVECDVPSCDDFITFSNLLFDVDDDFSSSDNESFSDEDISKEVYSNPLFDEEIISMKMDPHHFNVESHLIEFLLNPDSLIILYPSKIDSLLDEFAGELILLNSIPSGTNENDCDPEEEIRLIEKLLYDNSSPRLPEELIFENSDAAIESFIPSPIPVENSDSPIEEINFLLLWMTRCRRALRKITMTLKGIFSSLKNCLTMIPFHFLKMSHFILIFHHPLVLLQNHRMMIQEFLLSK
uniref:RNA-directed DNA polymerase, eukaryota, reverse transcriptase zinc-binding domain protein n=1 Tax=Tanacetum cinerariifolium TaxID=118510 RepID=A0A6L2M6A4_TANCI|nr:RNA-directed DNA polymerase, eukaryota, reverse transcriptase zinc-binding domain protein [Tanacetum cinerariifolium]